MSDIVSDAEDYEFLLGLLDDLDLVDLSILVSVQRAEDASPFENLETQDEVDGWVSERRSEAINMIKALPGLSESEIRPRLERLEARGLTKRILNWEDVVYTAGSLSKVLKALDAGKYVFLTGLYSRLHSVLGSGRFDAETQKKI